MRRMEQKILQTVLSQINHGTLTVTFWDGTSQTFGNGKPAVTARIRDPNILKKALKSPSLAFGEAYMDGRIEISPLEDAVKLAELNPMRFGLSGTLKSLGKLHKNKKSKQAEYIAHHYDLGNDFYKLWLDPTMSYSCAYFHTLKDTLETAQRQKTTYLLRKLQLEPGMSLLDIGSGWGFLLIEAAKKYKITGLGVSLSKEQVAYAQNLAKHEGVADRVTFRYVNYSDIPRNELFDRIISVGFYEHVGKDNLADYFKVVDRHLKPGGISVLHSITHREESPTDPWIDKYIFPGGYLPSVRETTSLIANQGFYMFDYENLGQHYGVTIEKWRQNYEKHKAKVIALYDEKFFRMWQLYLIGAMTAFKVGSANLSQWTFKKGQDPSWPLTREYLYKN
jgi:cyclopropane-fatty-acyl-phospholipid synthase